MTYSELYNTGKEILAEAGIGEAALDARLLLEYICGTDRNYLLAHGDEPVDAGKEENFLSLVKKRLCRIPLQQLTGVQCFMGLDFWVDEHVLIPRQDTEILVEEVLRNLHDGMRVLDLCTGSGCILISLLRYTNDCQGLGVDISEEALAVAQKNAKRLLEERDAPEGLAGIPSVRFLRSDLFESVEGTFDVIVSNPPYIPSAVIDTLMPEVKDHEPRISLDGGEDGLWFYRRILKDCKTYLVGGGMLFFEIGYDQGKAVCDLMKQADFLEVQIVKDYAGADRVVFGTLGLV